MKRIGKYGLKTSIIKIIPINEANVWNEPWNILLIKDDDKVIGTVSFEGIKELGSVPIKIELEERYRNLGYGTEALKMMTEWAFLHKDVYEIIAKCFDDNDKCIHALEKAGYVYRKRESNIETYSITKPKTTWLGLYIIIGITVGLILGIVVGNQWVGLAIGVFVGAIIGANMDSKANKERENIIGSKYSNNKKES